MSRAWTACILALAVVAAGCSLLPAPGEPAVDQLPVGRRIVTPPERIRIEAQNGTSIPVILVVNGKHEELAPHADAEITVAQFGPLPWATEFTTAAGRSLLRDTLRPGVISRTNLGGGRSEMSGFLARADLSCGQLFLVTNVASYGPAPGPGVAGDCD